MNACFISQFSFHKLEFIEHSDFLSVVEKYAVIYEIVFTKKSLLICKYRCGKSYLLGCVVTKSKEIQGKEHTIAPLHIPLLCYTSGVSSINGT